jgi:hypothetical protein
MTPTPNWFAIFALLSWPIVVLCLYRTRPVVQATLWTILSAQLLLPVGTAIKFAGIPQFDKISIPNLAALVGCLLVVRRPLRIWSGFGLAGILIFMYVIGPFITAELNGDPIVLADRTLPAESHYDALSAVVGQLLFLLPFFLGRQLLRSSADNEEILRVLVIAGLLYSLPMLFELRMSPQLHHWFYGYHAHQFIQQMRDGGYRPTVFMGHGLLVAFFVMTTVVAAAAFWRTQTRVFRFAPVWVTTYLSAMLVLCKSLGALIYGAALVPLIRFAKPQFQVRIAVILVAIAMLYPLLRAADIFPIGPILEVATSISEQRARSLETRINNEHQLLESASQRFIFGWGRWGRSRIYDEYGNDVSITDGRWIIVMGQFGLFGFLAEFGLLVLPVLRAASALKFSEPGRERIFFAALVLIVAINVVELLPNSSLAPWTWLLAGALLGRADALRANARDRTVTLIPQPDEMLVVRRRG